MQEIGNAVNAEEKDTALNGRIGNLFKEKKAFCLAVFTNVLTGFNAMDNDESIVLYSLGPAVVQDCFPGRATPLLVRR